VSARASYILKATSFLGEKFQGQMCELLKLNPHAGREVLIALLLRSENLLKLSCT